MYTTQDAHAKHLILRKGFKSILDNRKTGSRILRKRWRQNELGVFVAGLQTGMQVCLTELDMLRPETPARR